MYVLLSETENKEIHLSLRHKNKHVPGSLAGILIIKHFPLMNGLENN